MAPHALGKSSGVRRGCSWKRRYGLNAHDDQTQHAYAIGNRAPGLQGREIKKRVAVARGDEHHEEPYGKLRRGTDQYVGHTQCQKDRDALKIVKLGFAGLLH